MWFGEPHPFPERGSPTILSASGQQSYKGWSCRLWIFEFQARNCTEDHSMGQIKHLCSSSGKRKRLFSVRSVRVLMRRKLWTFWKNQAWDLNDKTLHWPGHNLSGQSSVCRRTERGCHVSPHVVCGEKYGVSPTTSVLTCNLLHHSSVLIPLSYGC